MTRISFNLGALLREGQMQKYYIFLNLGPASEPACEASKGKDRDSTAFFEKTREMASLGTSPRRRSSLLLAGAHSNGLLRRQGLALYITQKVRG